MNKKTIVLADDHQVVRHGLRVLLEAEPDFKIVGEASDGLEALEILELSKPDILILDLVMPGMNGLEVTRQAGKCSPRTSVVVLSMHTNEAYVVEALRAGARAYVLKSATSDELVRAIREAIGGHRYLSAPLSEHAIEVYTRKAEAAITDPYAMLTDRERMIFQLAAEGHTSVEIAAKLTISPRTAETHRSNLMRKLGLRTQSDLIRCAIRRGVLPTEH